MDELIRAAAQHIVGAKRLVVSTGAGISRESGIPTFRDAMEGLWAKYDPQELATPRAFKNNPRLVWDWYASRREMAEKASPNPGHYALAELEDLVSSVVIITQNIDNLHHRAGSTDIICLHGDLFAYKCADNCQGVPTPVDLAGVSLENLPPICPHCGQAYVRPDIVWFEEALPPANLERAFRESEQCDVMLVVGTSGVVYPAAHLPVRAKESAHPPRKVKEQEAVVIEINPNPSELTRMMDIHLAGPSGAILPQIVTAVRALLTAG